MLLLYFTIILSSNAFFRTVRQLPRRVPLNQIEGLSNNAFVLNSEGGKGFSNGSKISNLSEVAKKYLKESQGMMDIAQQRHFQDNVLSLKQSNPDLFSKLQNFSPSIASQVNMQPVHEKLVEITWDVMAEYLPELYKKTASKSSTEISKKLSIIAKETYFKTNCRVLDVGCGDGVMVSHLQKKGLASNNYIGIDLSEKMISFAKAAHPKFMFERISFLQYVSQAESFGMLYDSILFNGVLQFMPDIQDALYQATTLLSPGGRIVVSHVNGAEFVRDEQRGNRAVVLSVMPNTTELQLISQRLGASCTTIEGFQGRDASGGHINNMEKFYLAVLSNMKS